MILPIVGYGDPVLKRKAKPITKDYPKLEELLDNMWDTMYGAQGVGLAAPQIGLPIRVFLIDPSPFAEDSDLSDEESKALQGLKKEFINAQIEDESGDEWAFSEGCLSIPDVREDVFRKPEVTIAYQDRNFKTYTETFTGIAARVIQHEYDHIEGILFTDKLSSLKKRLIKGKLNAISKGKIDVDYRMKFPNLKRGR